MADKTQLCLRMRELRKEKGLNQRELAEKLGIKKNTYNGYETGKHRPNSNTLVKLSEEFNVTIDYLVGITNIKEDKNNSDLYFNQMELNMLNVFERLNDLGKQKVIEYITDLGQVKKYKT